MLFLVRTVFSLQLKAIHILVYVNFADCSVLVYIANGDFFNCPWHQMNTLTFEQTFNVCQVGGVNCNALHMYQ